MRGISIQSIDHPFKGVFCLSAPLPSDQRLPEGIKLGLSILKETKPVANRLVGGGVAAGLHLTGDEALQVIGKGNGKLVGHEGSPPMSLSGLRVR
jgi:hypothetical protein